MLARQNIFGETESKVEKSLDRIKFAYEQAQFRGLGALYVCYSGGKDSTVLAALCKMAKERYGVEYELHYKVTGIDPPELIQFMRDNFRLVCGDRVWGNLDGETLHWEMYEKSMWQLIEEIGLPPTRFMRYCCKELKESGNYDTFSLTGVRWAESIKRRNNRNAFEQNTGKAQTAMLFNDNDEGRQAFETCTLKRKLVCNPIIDWDEDDVWDFIHGNNIPYCKLYDEGETRLGCIGCPMNPKSQLRDFERYPKYKQMYINAFDRMLKRRKGEKNAKFGDLNWTRGEQVMSWWLHPENTDKPIDGQMSIWDGNE